MQNWIIRRRRRTARQLFFIDIYLPFLYSFFELNLVKILLT